MDNKDYLESRQGKALHEENLKNRASFDAEQEAYKAGYIKASIEAINKEAQGDLISREAVLEILKAEWVLDKDISEWSVYRDVADLPAIQPKQRKLFYHFFPAFENTYKAKDDREIKVKYDEFGIALITKELVEDWLKQFGYELIKEEPYKADKKPTCGDCKEWGTVNCPETYREPTKSDDICNSFKADKGVEE